ncbi:MAG: universal stress protein [Burkholderiaceae bacterium]
MFQKIMVPTDGSEISEKVVDIAIATAKLTKGSIVGLSVAHPYPFLPLTDSPTSDDVTDYENRSRSLAQQHVDKISAAASANNIPCEAVVVKSFAPYKEILDIARKKHCDSIFMASHGRRVDRWLLGSQTQKVLAHAEIPVVVCR